MIKTSDSNNTNPILLCLKHPDNKSLHPIRPVVTAGAVSSRFLAPAAPPVRTGELNRYVFLIPLMIIAASLCCGCGKERSVELRPNRTENKNPKETQKASFPVSPRYTFVASEKQDFFFLTNNFTLSNLTDEQKGIAHPFCLAITRDGRVHYWYIKPDVPEVNIGELEIHSTKAQVDELFQGAISDGILELYIKSMSIDEWKRSPPTNSIVAHINGKKIEISDSDASDITVYTKVKNRLSGFCSKAFQDSAK